MSATGHRWMSLLRPAAEVRAWSLAVAVVPLLVASAALVLSGAAVMPEGYSWRLHSISESAAQGQSGAWVTRMALLLFGAAVLALAISRRHTWPRLTYWANLVFAGCMFGAVAFSHRPWSSGAPSDSFEDFLHSVFASLMGLAFSAGVVARFLDRGMRGLGGRWLDVVALVSAVVMPLVLMNSQMNGGLAQRFMFLVAYTWFGLEAIGAKRVSGKAIPGR